MMIQRHRLASFGWAMMLAIATALVLGLTFKVNSVKGQVRLTERRIVALEREKLMLETEFETRANQQQLADWNDVDFGYVAPKASQYIDNERQLAQYGTPRAPGAPAPIRVASADLGQEHTSGFPSMVSPLTGKAVAAEMPDVKRDEQNGLQALSEQLGRNAARIALSAREAAE